MRVRKISLGAVALSSLLWVAAEAPSTTPASQKVREVEVQGKVVCLPELLHHEYHTELGAEHEHIFGFKTIDGELFTLLRTKYSDALFLDEQLRERELRLKGRVFPKSHVLEVTRTRSVRNGVVSDVYYYCTICNIESVSAGPCACCQDKVELKEKPLSGLGQPD